MEKIKAILLDVDNTILDFNQCARASIKATFADWELSYTEEMFPVFLEVNGYLWEEIEKETLTREELYRIRWKMIFERLGMEGTDPVSFDTHFRKYIGTFAFPVDGAYDLLEYLAKKYTLCIASNASRARQLKRLTKANMLSYVKHVFTSEEIGHPKPEKAFFDACLSQLDGVTAAETVIIGDSLTADIAGGVTAGMKTIWYNHFRVPVPPDFAGDYIVNSLREIQDIL
ncbi:MAG: noncanonical pyrimidine nucleotidase, YjjG family [Ruminococcaceae bacterium]|nr:noncanonical pyrimidine nucleotidase, YjjG family [Oscillospiraceae bacterium]